MIQSVSSGLYGSSYDPIYNKNPSRYELEKAFRSPGMKNLHELFLTLLGTAAGSTALANRKQVTAVQQIGLQGNGGSVAIENFEIINRATTAADVTDLTDLGGRNQGPDPYVADAAKHSDFAVGLGPVFTNPLP